jgi:hypothetical protein
MFILHWWDSILAEFTGLNESKQGIMVTVLIGCGFFLVYATAVPQQKVQVHSTVHLIVDVPK